MKKIPTQHEKLKQIKSIEAELIDKISELNVMENYPYLSSQYEKAAALRIYKNLKDDYCNFVL